MSDEGIVDTEVLALMGEGPVSDAGSTAALIGGAVLLLLVALAIVRLRRRR